MNIKRMEELIARLKIQDELQKAKKNKVIQIVLIVLGCLAVVGLVAFLVYRFLTPTYIEDFDDDFEDDFDDYFEDEDYDNVLASSSKAAREVGKKAEEAEAEA